MVSASEMKHEKHVYMHVERYIKFEQAKSMYTLLTYNTKNGGRCRFGRFLPLKTLSMHPLCCSGKDVNFSAYFRFMTTGMMMQLKK